MQQSRQSFLLVRPTLTVSQTCTGMVESLLKRPDRVPLGITGNRGHELDPMIATSELHYACFK